MEVYKSWWLRTNRSVLLVLLVDISTSFGENRYANCHSCVTGNSIQLANQVGTHWLVHKVNFRYPRVTTVALWDSYASLVPGADEQELATPILSLGHGIFTDWSIFSTTFLLWKKGISSPVTQWRQLSSCDWLCHSHGSIIQSRFDLKINRSMKMLWQELIVELHAPTHRPLLVPSNIPRAP